MKLLKLLSITFALTLLCAAVSFAQEKLVVDADALQKLSDRTFNFKYEHTTFATRNYNSNTKEGTNGYEPQHINRKVTFNTIDAADFISTPIDENSSYIDTFCANRYATIYSDNRDYSGQLNLTRNEDGSYKTFAKTSVGDKEDYTLSLGAALIYSSFLSGSFDDDFLVTYFYSAAEEQEFGKEKAEELAQGNMYAALQKIVWGLNENKDNNKYSKEGNHTQSAYQVGQDGLFNFLNYLDSDYGQEFGVYDEDLGKWVTDWTRAYDPVNDDISDKYVILVMNNNTAVVDDYGRDRKAQDFLVAIDKSTVGNISEVPEPATLAILGFGLAGAAVLRYRKRNA